MTTFDKNSQIGEQIRKLDQEYKRALQRGEEFSILKKIRDELKRLREQMHSNGIESEDVPDT